MGTEDDRPPDRTDRDWRAGFRQAAPLLGLGMQMALTMALFAGGGFWLDQRFSKAPLFTIAGTVLAIVALALHLARVVKHLDQDRNSRRPKS